MEINEKYMIQGNPYTVNGQEFQQRQPWWIYKMDLGMSDGSVAMNDQNEVRAGGRFGCMTPIQTNWMPEAPATAQALPHPAYAPEYNSDPANPQTLAEDVPAGWSWITPSQSVMGCGMEINYQQAKNMGQMNVFARWNPYWELPIAEQQANGIYPPFDNNYVPYNRWEGADVPGSCQLYTNGNPYPWLYDATESKLRNIGAIPYRYRDEDGEIHQLTAFVVAKEYNALDDTGTISSATQTNTTGSWELCDLNWGDFFGFSPQFGYDQPTIIPVNNDVIDNYNNIATDPGNPGAVPPVPPTFVDPSMGYKQNWVNSVWVGASDAEMKFNSDKNRFELGGLYTNNKLSSVNAPPTGTPPVPNPQVGETVAVLNGDQPDTEANVPYGTSQGVLSPNPFAPGTYGTVPDWDDRNQGVEDCISGVSLANVWFAPEGWIPPENLNPQNLTSPNVGNQAGLEAATNYNPYSPAITEPQNYINMTAENYKNFTKDLTLATADNWSGTMLDKMGFAYDQIIPYAGSQENRYSEWTYGKDNVAVQDEGVKPLMLNAELDTAATQVLNTYVWRQGLGPPIIPQPPYPEIAIPPATPDPGSLVSGTTLFRTGQLNNTQINLSAINGAVLTAVNQPSLYSTPYYVILTDLVPTQFQKGKMKQNAIYYGLKSYSAGQYFYIYASGYSQLVQNDRLVQSISTELRNPLTGELSRVGKNSSIIYKIEREISLPAITMTAEGDPIDEDTAATEEEQNSAILGEDIERVFKEEKIQEKSLHSILVAETKRGDEGVDAGYLERLIAENKRQLHPQREKVVINQADNFGGGHHPHEHLETKGESKRDDEGISMDQTKAERINPADVHQDIVKLLVEKGLSRSAITTGKSGNILNPFTINKSINSIVQKYKDKINQLVADRESGRLSTQELFEEVDKIGKNAEGHDFGIGVRGNVIHRDKQLTDHYRMDPMLTDAIAKDIVGGGGRGVLTLLKEGAIKDEIQVVKTKEDATKQPKTAEEATELRRRTREESNLYKGLARRARNAGVERAVIVEADNAAKRMADKMDPDKGKEYNDILARERKMALSEPIKYLKETAGGEVELSDRQKKGFDDLDIAVRIRSSEAPTGEPKTPIRKRSGSVTEGISERIQSAREERYKARLERVQEEKGDASSGGAPEA